MLLSQKLRLCIKGGMLTLRGCAEFNCNCVEPRECIIGEILAIRERDVVWIIYLIKSLKKGIETSFSKRVQLERAPYRCRGSLTPGFAEQSLQPVHAVVY